MIRSFFSGIMLLYLSISVAQAMELPELLEKISEIKVKHADFIETRTAFYLDKPIISKGSMDFTSPDKLKKHYTEPGVLTQSISGDNLTIHKTNKAAQKISLQNQPALALGINTIRWILSGDLENLDKHFELQYSYKLHNWQLQLTPADKRMLDYISAILVSGKSENILKIQVTSANGDSVTTKLYGHR